MMKRFLSLILVFSLVLTAMPVTARAAEDPFILKVDQYESVPAGYIGIYNKTQFLNMVNAPEKNYILMADIDLGNYTTIFSYKAPFRGILEGNGYTVSMKISASSMGSALISHVDNGEIRNLHVKGSISVTFPSGYDTVIGQGGYTAGLVSSASGNVEIYNCVSDVNITTNEGANQAGEMDYGFAGILGGHSGDRCTLQIEYCRNNGNITGGSAVCGILTKHSNFSNTTVKIFGCENNGDLTATGTYSFAAGIAGFLGNGKGEFCIGSSANNGNITAGTVAAGIVQTLYSYKGTALAVDCINTGTITTKTRTEDPYASDASGIADSLSNNASVSTCVNIGELKGKNSNSAIACTLDSKYDLLDCYWLDTAKTAYSKLGNQSGIVDRTGAVTKEQMAQEEALPKLDFEETWVMHPKGYPYPQALIHRIENYYKLGYIESTEELLDGSYRLVSIMPSTGAGGLGGLLHREVEKAGLDTANSITDFISNFNEALNGNLEIDIAYSALLTDIVTGAVSKDVYNQCVSDAFFATLSELITYLAPMLDSATILATEDYLKEMRYLPSIFDSKASVLVDKIRGSILAKVDYETLGKSFTYLDSFVSLMDAVSAECDDKEELFDFYVLCNTHVKSIVSYCEILNEMAGVCATINIKEGAEIVEATKLFTEGMIESARNNPSTLYDNSDGYIGDVIGSGASVVFDAVASITSKCYWLVGIKTGFKLGTAIANELTSMDVLSYNCCMLNMAGYMAQGMFYVVKDYQDDFDASGSYEDAYKLNSALELYLSLQILACDYAIGYNTGLVEAALAVLNPFKMKEDQQAINELIELKATLTSLLKSGRNVRLGDDGSITGFIAKCPVTVVVTEKATGAQIARLSTGEMTHQEGFEGLYLLNGQHLEQKAGYFDPKIHEAKIIGDSEGTMDLATFRGDGGRITYSCAYQDLPVSKGMTYVIGDDHLIRNGKETVEPKEKYALDHPFVDVESGRYYEEPVVWAVENGVTNGMDATHFAPDNVCSRGQVVTFLWRINGQPAPKSTVNPFKDVQKGKYYYEAVLWAVEEGITNGVSADKFAPDEICTRGQVATFLWRAVGNPTVQKNQNPFTDVLKGKYYYDAVLWAVESGVTNGISANSFAPNDSCTRGQIVTFLYRAVK